MPSRSTLGLIWLTITLCQASSALLTRYCDLPATSIGFWRAFGAAVIFAPWAGALWWKKRPAACIPKGAVLAGIFFGLHFATWAWALQHTTIANAMLGIGLLPLVTPWLGRAFVGDRLNAWESTGAALASGGMAWVIAGQALFTPGHLPGSLMALLSMLCCALYLVFGRKHRAREHVLRFSVGVYIVAAATQALGAWLLQGGISLAPGRTLAALVALILVPTVAGHTLMMYLLRHAKAHTVGLSVPTQFVFNTLAAVFLFGEFPSRWFYPGAAVVGIGVLVAILKAGPTPPCPAPHATPS